MRTDDLISLLAADLPTQPTKAEAVLSRWLVVSAALAGIGFLGLVGIRQDLAGSGLAPTLAKLALGAMLAVSAAVGARRLVRPDVPTVAVTKGLLAVCVFLALLVAGDVASRGMDGWLVRLSGKSILICLIAIPALAAPPLVASLMAIRRGATSAPATTGALAGLAAAGLAICAYGLFCTEDSLLFVAVWYAMAAGIVAVVGAGLGRLTLRW
jgi:hypothetical protein